MTTMMICLLALSANAATPKCDAKTTSPFVDKQRKVEVPAEVREIVAKYAVNELTWPKSKGRVALEAIKGAQDALLALGMGKDLSLGFKALEAYLTLGGRMEDAAARCVAARAYAVGIATSRTHNMFGLVGEVRTSSTSRNLLGLGEETVAAFLPLLKSKAKLNYEGSEEPTLAKLHGWRIKDLAASYLAVWFNEAFDANAAPAKRDAVIAKLANRAL